MEVHILASGSDGNCAVIRGEESSIIVDAGISRKRILHLMSLNGIDCDEIEAILVTHEHTDHVKSVGSVARKLDIPVYCTKGTKAYSCMGEVDWIPVSGGKRLSIAGFDVFPMNTSHNAAEPVCYEISENGKKVLIATDTGLLPPMVKHSLSEADVAVIESNYDRRMLSEGPYPYSLKKLIDSDCGHLSNVVCANAIQSTKKDGRRLFLAHLSKTNNTPDVAKSTISEITGIRRSSLDCLDPEVIDDTRAIKI